MTTKQSPVLQFITLAWQNASRGVPHSWERINHTMSRAVMVAIGAFEFTLDDYAAITNGGYRSGYWLNTENCYTAAIVNGNTSAALSIEKHLGREPIIADDVDPPDNWQDRNTHLVGVRQRERLHVGARLPWRGEKVTVTSMGRDSATACSYRPRKDEWTDKEFDDWLESKGCDPVCLSHTARRLLRPMFEQQSRDYSNKVLHRYTITREAVIADREDRKRRQEIRAALTEMQAKGDRGEVVKQLQRAGIITDADFDKATLKKLERVLAKVSQ